MNMNICMNKCQARNDLKNMFGSHKNFIYINQDIV